MNSKGIIQIDLDNLTGDFDGYSIDGIPLVLSQYDIAKENLGKEVEYELEYSGYRRYGMFSKDFYKKAKIVV